MKKIPKPRMRKSKAIPIHVGKPLVMHGWKCPIKWIIKGWRRPSRSIRKVAQQIGWEGLLEAREIGEGMLKDGWDSIEISMEEILTPKMR